MGGKERGSAIQLTPQEVRDLIKRGFETDVKPTWREWEESLRKATYRGSHKIGLKKLFS